MLRLLSASLLVAAASASYCGDSSIPFSVEVLPDGGLILGCARPTCFGWGPAGTPATNNAFFYRINNVDDGFMRSERDSIPPYDQSDARYYNAQTATCEQNFASANCAGVNQWVGGIAPLHNVSAYPIVLRCCSFDALLQSEDRGLAIMHAGQIVVGGEVINSGIQAGFDYISDIAKSVRPDGSVVYDVAIRRMPCSGLSDGHTKYRKNAQAYQAPTVTAEQALPLPPAGSNSQNGILEEIIQEEAIQLPPGTQFQQPVQPIQPPVGPQGPVVQAPPVGQVAAPQYYPAAPVQFYSGGGGGGGQWCFSGDMTVEVMDGTTKRMDELTKQDWVLAVSEKQLEYVPVEFWLHRVPAQEAEFNEFETEDGKTIKLTDKHYIYKGDCSRVGTGGIQLNELPRDAVFADQVHAGDCLIVVGEDRNMHEKRVVRASKVTETGIYAPMTSSGRIIVNGIHASCHNIFQEHTSGHAFFKYVDMFNDAYEAVFGANTEEIVETPAGLSLVIAMADLVVPKHMAEL